MEVSNIFDILKEELRKNDLNADLFSTDVLKISRSKFDRLKYCVLWSQNITGDGQKIINDIQGWLNEQKEKRDLNEVFDNLPKAKFTSLIKKLIDVIIK